MHCSSSSTPGRSAPRSPKRTSFMPVSYPIHSRRSREIGQGLLQIRHVPSSLKQMFRFVLLFVAAALCSACDSSHAGPRVFRIAVVPKGSSHSFWRAVHCGAARADADFADVEIVWNAPVGEN